MIVTEADFGDLRGEVAMVDGGFDPLHDGHIEYFRAASELGAPVLCNLSSDEYVGGKHPPLLPDTRRAVVIDAIRYIDHVYVSRSATASVLESLAPRFYVKGTDWEGRLPAEEIEICDRVGIEIVYLDTVRDSSTRILDDYVARAGS